MRFFSLLFVFQILFFVPKMQAKQEWQRVYLATYPRCGNHWTRWVLEEATQIATGSVYRDREPRVHLKKTFPWGGYSLEGGYEGNCRYPESGEIVVIKTHYPAKQRSEFDLQPAIKVIRIVRYPLDAFYSHFLHHPRYGEIPADGKIPSDFVKRSIASWKKFESYWDRQPDVLTIRYEDLFIDPHFYFQKMFQAMGYQLSEEDLNRAIAKFPPQGGLFKHAGDFHSRDLKLMSKELGPLMEKYEYPIPLNEE